MNTDFDALLQQLQEHIFEETRRTFGEKVYQRWRNPLYMGVMDNADGRATVKGTCGDNMEMFLKFDNDLVVNASFQTDGCGPTVVCGSYAAEMAMGKAPDDLFDITGESILKELGGLPQEHVHCAFLAAESLQAAANDYMIRQARKPNKNA
jgi:nitrogen fixation NifU-like protein